VENSLSAVEVALARPRSSLALISAPDITATGMRARSGRAFQESDADRCASELMCIAILDTLLIPWRWLRPMEVAGDSVHQAAAMRGSGIDAHSYDGSERSSHLGMLLRLRPLKAGGVLSELVIYDRLVVPVPPKGERHEWERWACAYLSIRADPCAVARTLSCCRFVCMACEGLTRHLEPTMNFS
jgi:hypothetical protein